MISQLKYISNQDIYLESDFWCIGKLLAAQLDPVVIDRGEAVVENSNPGQDGPHHHWESVQLTRCELSTHSLDF